MRVIHKYTLLPETTLDVPEDSKILLVAEQHDDVCLWMESDTTKPLVRRRFQVFPTGREIPKDSGEDALVHLGCVGGQVLS